MRTHTRVRVCMATVDSKGNVSKICIFVRNLPYSTTDEELEAVFKRYGALVSCFTVKDKGKAGYSVNWKTPFILFSSKAIKRLCLCYLHKEVSTVMASISVQCSQFSPFCCVMH